MAWLYRNTVMAFNDRDGIAVMGLSASLQRTVAVTVSAIRLNANDPDRSRDIIFLFQ